MAMAEPQGPKKGDKTKAPAERRGGWLSRIAPGVRGAFAKRETPENLWVKCPDTGEMIYRSDLEAALWVTPAGRHMRIGPEARQSLAVAICRHHQQAQLRKRPEFLQRLIAEGRGLRGQRHDVGQHDQPLHCGHPYRPEPRAENGQQIEPTEHRKVHEQETKLNMAKPIGKGRFDPERGGEARQTHQRKKSFRRPAPAQGVGAAAQQKRVEDQNVPHGEPAGQRNA